MESPKIIAGVDEAGRGPLAGPVIAAAVILDPAKPIKGLRDSKVLTEKQREALFLEIRQKALCWAVAKGSLKEIEEINILQASLLAMQRAVNRLSIQPELALVDGNQAPKLTCLTQTIIQGDDKEPAISAASIIAKVLRDRFMKRLDKHYPNYGFAQHKGYATAFHCKAIEQHGPSRMHRRSFEPIATWLANNK